MNETNAFDVAPGGVGPAAPGHDLPRRKTRWWFPFVIVLVLLLALETASYLIALQLSSLGAVYKPAPANYADYMANRDPVLGWPTRKRFGGDLDMLGARKEPAFPDPSAMPLMSVYGDSFVYSNDVDDESAWPNVLARGVGQRINNFGVGAYSTAQAYLRFHANTQDSSRIVVLGFLSENIKRNVNQFATLLRSGDPALFRPRFILNAQGGLELVPLPTFTADEFPYVIAHPQRYLRYEIFAPGGMAGVQAFAFPFTWTVGKALVRNDAVASVLRGEPGGYSVLYKPDHPSHAFEITVQIMERFVADARAQGRTPYILVIPKGTDLSYHRKTGRWVYQRLLDTLEAKKLPMWHVGDDMLSRIGARSVKDFYVDGDLRAHPNRDGNKLMAEIVREYMERERLYRVPYQAK